MEHGPEIDVRNSLLPYLNEGMSVPITLERFFDAAAHLQIEDVDGLLASVLYHAMNAMAPAVWELTEDVTGDGFVTPEGVKVRPASDREAFGPALVLELDGEAFLLFVRVRTASSYGQGDTGVEHAMRSSRALHSGRGTVTAVQRRHHRGVAHMSVCRLDRTDEGPSPRLLYQVGAPSHRPGHADDIWETSKEAVVSDVSSGLSPFHLLRSALDATGLLDDVRRRSVEFGSREHWARPWREADRRHHAMARAVALLDDGVPGPEAARRLMEVFHRATAANLQDVAAALPDFIDALVAGGHVSMQDAFGSEDAVPVYVIPADHGAILHLGNGEIHFHLQVRFAGDGSVGHLTISRSHVSDAALIRSTNHACNGTGGREMGSYLVEDDLLVPDADGTSPDDLDLPMQVNHLRMMVSFCSKWLATGHVATP